MTTQEFSTQFDVLYDNISSGQAPGLTEYEKSIFLTKAQDEIIKNYFNPKGNKYEEGFDDSPKRQIDLSMLMKTIKGTEVTATVNLHFANNVGYFKIPDDILLYVNEIIQVSRGSTLTKLVTVPLSFNEYSRLMSKPFKRPLKNQAWRLISSGEGDAYTYTDYGTIAKNLAATTGVTASFENIYKTIVNQTLEAKDVADNSTETSTTRTVLLVNTSYFKSDGTVSADENDGVTVTKTDITNNVNKTLQATDSVVQIIPGPGDKITDYIIRYVKRPSPIVLDDLDGLTIDGVGTPSPCVLDPILHQEILQRAVELAKAAYAGDLQSAVELGKRSE